jgi:hypothetical protein
VYGHVSSRANARWHVAGEAVGGGTRIRAVHGLITVAFLFAIVYVWWCALDRLA